MSDTLDRLTNLPCRLCGQPVPLLNDADILMTFCRKYFETTDEVTRQYLRNHAPRALMTPQDQMSQHILPTGLKNTTYCFGTPEIIQYLPVAKHSLEIISTANRIVQQYHYAYRELVKTWFDKIDITAETTVAPLA